MTSNKKRFLFIVILLIVIISTNVISIKLTNSKKDMDYQKLKLEINDNDIDYYTIYSNDSSYEYKVYKINDYYQGDSMDEIRAQLENNSNWSRKKFYEYIMMKFYDKIGRKLIEIDREDLYYYNDGSIYAIIDAKNAKLYYLKNHLGNYHNDYNEVLGIKISNLTDMEIYSVKAQWAQNDGVEYYTYMFEEEKGNEIEKYLSKSTIWNTEKLDNEILNCFEYNNEIFDIQNGYYRYEKVYTENNSYKSSNNTKEETGYQVGVYDCDKDILYYYWRSI